MRVFVGFQLPKDIVNTIIHTQDYLQRSVSRKNVIRWIPPENLHVTAIFLGKVDENKVKKIKLSLKKIGKKYRKTEFTVKSFGLWPKGKYPRIVVYNLNHPPVYAQLQAELDVQLTPFAPHIGSLKPAHVTVGRVNKKAKSRDIQKLSSVVRSLELDLNKISLAAPCLFQSILSPKGSEYKVL